MSTLISRGPQVRKFFEAFLSHRKGEHAGEKFALEPWQQEFMDEFYEVDEEGKRLYRLGFLGVPRGNGKTPLAAGLGLYELVTRPDAPNVFNVAGAKDQAKLLIDSAREMVEDSLQLDSWVETSRSVLRAGANHGVMRVLSSEGRLLHGLNPTAILFDELHAVTQPPQEEAYIAMVSSLHKRLAYLLNITTAGYDKATILGRAYDEALRLEDGEDRNDGCLRIRRDRDNGVLFYWYGVPENLADQWMDEDLWRLANPASFVSIDELRKQLHAPGFHELDFKRLHLNMWTAARTGWLPPGLWTSLRSDSEIPDGGDIYVMVDVGMYHDTTAVAWAHPREDPTNETGWKVVTRSHVWSVLQDVPHDTYVQGGRMRLDLIGDFLRQLGKKYRIREVVFDPALFAAEADRLSDEGFPMFELNPGTTAQVEAYQVFYAAAKSDVIEHSGDPVLAAHVEATAADMTERGWRVRKLKSTSVIDAAIAAVGAVWRALRREPPSKYEKEGLFLLDVGVEEEDELEEDDVYTADDDYDEEDDDDLDD